MISCAFNNNFSCNYAMFDSMPRYLKGIDCFREMMEAKDTTRMNQGVWEGWYYEFFVERYLREHPTDAIIWWSKKGEDQLDFDLRFPYEDWFYGDMKSDAQKKDVQGNLKENIDFLVLEMVGVYGISQSTLRLSAMPPTTMSRHAGGTRNLASRTDRCLTAPA